MAYSERELLARLVKCEARTEKGKTGMKAVATVVLNRVQVPYGEYARISRGAEVLEILFFRKDSLIAHQRRFGGRYNPQNIYNSEPEEIHYYIADWAIAGNKLNEVGDCLWFLNPFRPDCSPTFPYNGSGTFHTRVNQHCFYRPTSLYADT